MSYTPTPPPFTPAPTPAVVICEAAPADHRLSIEDIVRRATAHYGERVQDTAASAVQFVDAALDAGREAVELDEKARQVTAELDAASARKRIPDRTLDVDRETLEPVVRDSGPKSRRRRLDRAR
jgi:hypothetical protein